VQRYVINLDRSPERLAWFQAQAAAMGLAFERVPAVDGRALPAAELARLRGLMSGRNAMSEGEIGCLLSHREAWRRVAEGDDPWAFVAEDDVHLARGAAALLAEAAWVPPGLALVKAETNFRPVELARETTPLGGGHELRGLRSYHMCTGGYFVSRDGAAALLEFSQDRVETADEIMFCPEHGIGARIGIRQLLPAICVQEKYLRPSATGFLDSIIEAERKSERREHFAGARPTGWRKLWREVRRVWRQGRERLELAGVIRRPGGVLVVVPYRER
jgi:glycosyl transferase, family 25